jgi:ABC-type xylose transport system permease subunit
VTDFDVLGRSRAPGALQLWIIALGTATPFVVALGGLQVYRWLQSRSKGP